MNLIAFKFSYKLPRFTEHFSEFMVIDMTQEARIVSKNHYPANVTNKARKKLTR